MKGKSVLTSQQIAHVLALHLAGRSLFIEELALLTGNVLPASDERWRELERLGLAERVSSPHGTAWKAGDETAAFIRSQLPLLKEFFRPDEKAYALTCLHEQASLSDCETVLSRISQCAERDRNILPLLELAVLFLLRWGRRNGSTAGLDGKFLNLVFAVQGLSFNSTELLKKILRLSALAYGLARKNGNKRFLALLMLSRMSLHVFMEATPRALHRISSRPCAGSEAILMATRRKRFLCLRGCLPICAGISRKTSIGSTVAPKKHLGITRGSTIHWRSVRSFPQGICSNSILRLVASSFFGARRR